MISIADADLEGSVHCGAVILTCHTMTFDFYQLLKNMCCSYKSFCSGVNTKKKLWYFIETQEFFSELR